MPNEKFRVFTEIPTNEKRIVNMINNEELTLEDACDLLNKQDQDIQKYRDAFYKAHEIQQDFIKQIQQIKSIMDNELKNAFNNRINHDDYNKDPELAEYFKGYHCGVSDLIKKIMGVLH